MTKQKILFFTQLLAIILCFLASSAFAQRNFTFEAKLDPFINLPGAYKLNPENLPEMFKKGQMTMNPYFQWLTTDKSRAIFKRKPASNVIVDISLLNGEVPIQEAIVDFKDGKFYGTTISIFNRGDGGHMSKEDFETAFIALGRHIGKQLDTRPRRRTGDIKRGVLTSGYTWFSARGMAVLEYNPGARSDPKQKIEFLRLRLSPRHKSGVYAAALDDRSGAKIRLLKLRENVKKESNGDVYIENVPMVDQGAKGYCVVASVQRLFEYMGVPCDMHQLAQISNSDPNRGTSISKTNSELGAIDHLFQMRYECLSIRSGKGLVEPLVEKGKMYIERDARAWDAKKFEKVIQKWTDTGLPLLWAMELGRFPEEPAISQQASGGHMRLIVGYNFKEGKLYFSDSWGAGHERKSMSIEHARKATTGIFLMKPITG